ncbi:MAG: response regulator [Gaiellaceae bacterium]
MLVVDDDAALRMLCRVNLELDGYKVLEAEGVDEAAEYLEDERVDVVLLDVHMGDNLKGGLGLLGRLEGRVPRPAVALLTGSMDTLRFEKPAGVDAILTKPFALDELARLVEGLAGRM